MNLIIDNIVCPSCIHFVKMELKKLGISYNLVETDGIKLSESLTEEQYKLLRNALLAYDLLLEPDFKGKTVMDLKEAIDNFVNNPEIIRNVTLPAYIFKKINLSQDEINNKFFQEAGETIDEYYNSKKIDRVILLLTIHNLTTSEIAYQLNYNSEKELICHFQRNTGLTPNRYKQINASTWKISTRSNSNSHAFPGERSAVKI
jgi:AraC-like DNA-binding protein